MLFVFLHLPHMPDIAQDTNALLQQYFDKVLVLTVPRFKDRHEKVKQRMAGISFDFFYGTDKNELTPTFIREQYVYDRKLSLSVRQEFKEMNLGEIACALSHRSIYQAMIDNNWQRVLILEDDVIPDFTTLPLLATAIKELPANWELFYLGYLRNEKITASMQLKKAWYQLLAITGFSKLSVRQISHLYPQSFSSLLMKAGFHDCTHAYAITLEGAKKLLKRQNPVQYRADNLLTAEILDGNMQAFVSKSFFFNQEIFTDGANQSYVREPQKLSVS